MVAGGRASPGRIVAGGAAKPNPRNPVPKTPRPGGAEDISQKLHNSILNLPGVAGGFPAGHSIAPGECERVARQRDMGPAGAEDHLHDIDAHRDGGVAEKAQPRLGPADDCLFLCGIHGIRGTAGTVRGARFYFHEDERLFLAADEIDFASIRRTEIPVEDLEAVAAQVARGEAIANPPRAEMRRLSGRTGIPAEGPGEKFCDEWGKGHGV